MTAFEEILFLDGRLFYKSRGVSMHIRTGDLVFIETFEEWMKPYDVALYKSSRRG